MEERVESRRSSAWVYLGVAAVTVVAATSLRLVRGAESEFDYDVRWDSRSFRVTASRRDGRPPLLRPPRVLVGAAVERFRGFRAFDADGREVPAHHGGGRLVWPAEAEQIAFSVRLSDLRADNVSSAVLRDGALAVPLGALGLPASLPAAGLTAGAAVHAEWLDRGLLVAGPGWRELRGARCRVLHPAGEGAAAAAAGERVSAALAHLEELGVAPPRRTPAVLVVRADPDVALTTFSGAPVEDVYVVEHDGELLASTLYRDLASSACERLARSRPADEHPLWISLAPSLELDLHVSLGQDEYAAARFAAIARAYHATNRVGAALAVDGFEGAVPPAFVRDVVAPMVWRSVEETGVGVPALVHAACERPETPVVDLVLRAHGDEVAAAFRRALYEKQYLADPPRSTGFPAGAGPGRPEDVESRIDVLYSSLAMGFLDNCGCSVNQDGGMPRRAAAIRARRAERPHLLLVELGDFLAPPYSEHQRSHSHGAAMIEILGELEYDAVVPGIAELSQDPEWFLRTCAAEDLPLVVANARPRGSWPVPPAVRAVRAGGLEWNVVGLVEPAYERYRYAAVERTVLRHYALRDPVDALLEVLASARPEEHWLAAGTLAPDTVRRILSSPAAPLLDGILSSSWSLALLRSRDGGTGRVRLRTAPDVGLYGNVFYGYPLLERFGLAEAQLGLRRGRVVAASLRGVPLGSDVERDEAVSDVLLALARREAGDPATWEPTPLGSLPAERRGLEYAGVDACTACHADVVRSWRSTGHARAIAALASRGRDFDPACLRCHTTGFGLESGFDPRSASSARLSNVQCEVCHGPSREHVEARRRGATAAAGPPRMPDPATCTSCHDRENSPDFDFGSFLPRVDHRATPPSDDVHAMHGAHGAARR